MAKKDIGVICSMSYYEMKLMVNVLTDCLEDNEVMGVNTKKSITNLIYRLNDMLTKQGYVGTN
jgi:hypothetical protein